MANPLLSVRIPPQLDLLIEERIREEGGDRSKVAIAALTQFLVPNAEDDVAQLRQRVQMLEMQMKRLEAQVSQAQVMVA
jgi:hypothetical protein